MLPHLDLQSIIIDNNTIAHAYFTNCSSNNQVYMYAHNKSDFPVFSTFYLNRKFLSFR